MLGNIGNKASSIFQSRFILVSSFIYVISRLPTWFYPYDSDHWIFWYVGQNWLRGGELYITAWDHKAPLIFLINGLIAESLGSSIIVFRFIITMVSIGSIYYFYKLLVKLKETYKLKISDQQLKFSTSIFIIFNSLSQLTNSANNTENFGILFLILTWVNYLNWKHTNKIRELLYVGFFVSLLFMLKANFMLLLLPIGLDIIRNNWKHKFRIIGNGLLLATPLILQTAFWVIYFGTKNHLHEFYVAVFQFNSQYLRAGWSGNISGQIIFLAILALFLSVFALPIVKSFTSRIGIIRMIALTTILFSAILGTFYSHYYLIVVPYLVIILAFTQIRPKPVYNLAILLLVLTNIAVSYRQFYNFFGGDVRRQFDSQVQIANYINKRTKQDEPILFYGYGATFYRLTDRPAATRYISASHPLLDYREGFGHEFNQKFFGDIMISNPRFIVTINEELYSQNQPIWEYIDRNYELDQQAPASQYYKVYIREEL